MTVVCGEGGSVLVLETETKESAPSKSGSAGRQIRREIFPAACVETVNGEYSAPSGKWN